MAELAQRLNELALANSNGFLNDDEYRLLRQNAFEEYSVSVVVPTETPVVPISASMDVHFRLHTPVVAHHTASYGPPETPKTPPSSRQKSTITSGVTSLLNKASGRRTPKHTRDPISSTPIISREVHAMSKPSTLGRESPSGTSKLSAMIPRLLQRRPTYRRTTETPRPLTDALHASRTIGSSRSPFLQPPISPQSSHFPVAATPNKSNLSLHLDIPQDSLPATPVTHTTPDIFSDDNLSTSADVRIAISKTEDELIKLIDAFVALETRTQRQLLNQKAHRIPANTPASVDILLEGKEWREHRRIPSIPRSAPLLDSSHRHLFASPPRTSLASDRASLRSASSNKTDFSQSISTASLHRIGSSCRSTPGLPTGGSPLQVSALLKANGAKASLTAPRKNSVSSTTTSLSSFKSRSRFMSRNTNATESARPVSPSGGAGGGSVPGSLRLSSVLARSRSQLGLRKLKESSWMFSEETLLSVTSSIGDDTGSVAASGVDHSLGQRTEVESDPSIVDIRRRKERLIVRYNARLEFLRAKLRSAEIHECLLKK